MLIHNVTDGLGARIAVRPSDRSKTRIGGGFRRQGGHDPDYFVLAKPSSEQYLRHTPSKIRPLVEGIPQVGDAHAVSFLPGSYADPASATPARNVHSRTRYDNIRLRLPLGPRNLKYKQLHSSKNSSRLDTSLWAPRAHFAASRPASLKLTTGGTSGPAGR